MLVDPLQLTLKHDRRPRPQGRLPTLHLMLQPGDDHLILMLADCYLHYTLAHLVIASLH